MITDRNTLTRLADLEVKDGIPFEASIAARVALLHAMPGDGRRATLAAMTEGTNEHRRLVGVHATRGVVHAWHGLLGHPDWRAKYDPRKSTS